MLSAGKHRQEVTRDIPCFLAKAAVESRLAAAGLGFGKIHGMTKTFQDFDHVHSGLREELVHETGDEQGDIHDGDCIK